MLQQSVFLLNTVFPKIQDLISEFCQEKIQGVVKGAALELYGSFG